MSHRLVVLLAILTLTLPAAAGPLPRVPPGFTIETVLEAPAIEAPTALCVAPNGDVYFAEDPMDMGGPPTQPLDRIWLLKGGDPRHKLLIADHLWAVMGLELVGHKLYVVNAPHVTMITLRADGTAAERKDLFTDLGPPMVGVPSFNDHAPSGIRQGMDGWMYVSIGDKGIPRMTRKETGQGSVDVTEGREKRTRAGHCISLEGGGVIRFRPDGTDLQVFASGTRNHLDVPLDDQDRIFVRDNTDDGLGWWTRFMYVTEGGYYGYPWAYTRHPDEVLPMIHDFGGGSPCGGWVYEDDGLPAQYRGRVFHCEWGQGKVWAVRVVPEGAGFKYVDQIAVVNPEGTAVTDFRPFTIRPTADGRGFYVTDWGFSGWLQPKKVGRLFKITYTGQDVHRQPRGHDTDSIADLIRSLNHLAHSERLRAQRALVAHGKAAWPALERALNTPRQLSPQGRAHALWALRQSGNPAWVKQALRMASDPAASVRLQAVRVLGDCRPNERLPGMVEAAHVLLHGATADSDPQVRLHAAQALAAVPGAPSWMPQLVQSLNTERDRFVRFAIVRTLKRVADWDRLRPALTAAHGFESQPRVQHALCWALTESYDPAALMLLHTLAQAADTAVRQHAVEALARTARDRKPYAGGWWGTQPAARTPPAHDVDWSGTPTVRSYLTEALADHSAAVRRAAILGLLTMSDPQVLPVLRQQFARENDAATRLEIIRAVGGLHSRGAADFLGAIAVDTDNLVTLRVEAVASLETVGRVGAAVLASLAEQSQTPAVQARALEAIGTLRLHAATAAVHSALRSRDATVRAAAALALGKIGAASAARKLLPLLQDPAARVRNASLQSLGELKARVAIPELIQATARAETQFDAIAALARMPDVRALQAYLTGLTSKNTDLRAACRAALAAIRPQATPVLEELARRHELRAEVLPELRLVYSSFAPILSWRLIGPFPDDGKVHPPERDQNFAASYRAFEHPVRWQSAQADANNHGHVDLAARFNPNTHTVAYGYAEVHASVARPAQLQVGSDDSIVIWLNGQKIHDHPGDRGWSPDADRVAVQLTRGINRLLIKCGNDGGPWAFSVAVSDDASRYAFLKGTGGKLDLNAYRLYARNHPGVAARGRQLFMDLKGLACAKCHAIAGQGGQVGPDLAGIGLKYRREDLMTSILEPSKVIAQGYETIVITTTRGKVLTGVFKGENSEAVYLTDANGQKHMVLKSDMDDRKFSNISTMPNGLSDGMTLQDFADLLAFLEQRREQPAVGGSQKQHLR